MTLPSEIQRAKHLTDQLHSAVATAKKFGLPKVRLEIEIAEELVQLLADSLKTIHQFELVEFDGKIKPHERQRLPAPPMTLGLKFRLIHDWQFRTNNDVFTCRRGHIVTVDQIDEVDKKVLIDFGGGRIDWFHRSVLRENFERVPQTELLSSDAT